MAERSARSFTRGENPAVAKAAGSSTAAYCYSGQETADDNVDRAIQFAGRRAAKTTRSSLDSHQPGRHRAKDVAFLQQPSKDYYLNALGTWSGARSPATATKPRVVQDPGKIPLRLHREVAHSFADAGSHINGTEGRPTRLPAVSQQRPRTVGHSLDLTRPHSEQQPQRPHVAELCEGCPLRSSTEKRFAGLLGRGDESAEHPSERRRHQLRASLDESVSRAKSDSGIAPASRSFRQRPSGARPTRAGIHAGHSLDLSPSNGGSQRPGSEESEILRTLRQNRQAWSSACDVGSNSDEQSESLTVEEEIDQFLTKMGGGIAQNSSHREMRGPEARRSLHWVATSSRGMPNKPSPEAAHKPVAKNTITLSSGQRINLREIYALFDRFHKLDRDDTGLVPYSELRMVKHENNGALQNAERVKLFDPATTTERSINQLALQKSTTFKQRLRNGHFSFSDMLRIDYPQATDEDVAAMLRTVNAFKLVTLSKFSAVQRVKARVLCSRLLKLCKDGRILLSPLEDFLLQEFAVSDIYRVLQSLKADIRERIYNDEEMTKEEFQLWYLTYKSKTGQDFPRLRV